MSDEIGDEDDARYELSERIYVESGWMRYLPHLALDILEEIEQHGRQTIGALYAHLSSRYALGLAAGAWEPELWTEEERRKVIEADGEELASLEELNASAEREHAAAVARFETYADALGVPRIHTMFDLLTFAVACRVLTAEVVDGETWIDLNPHAPLPEEVLPLSEDERRKEDKIRWQEINDPVVQGVIELFGPAGERPLDVKKTSLQQLARQLGITPEAARAGLACLLEEGDFAANRDPEKLGEHEVFEVRVDWEEFARTRISIQLVPPGKDDQQQL